MQASAKLRHRRKIELAAAPQPELQSPSREAPQHRKAAAADVSSGRHRQTALRLLDLAFWCSAALFAVYIAVFYLGAMPDGTMTRDWNAILPGMYLLYAVAALGAAVGGLVFIFGRGTIGGPVMSVGFGLYGVLVIVALAAAQTMRHACAKLSSANLNFVDFRSPTSRRRRGLRNVELQVQRSSTEVHWQPQAESQS